MNAVQFIEAGGLQAARFTPKKRTMKLQYLFFAVALFVVACSQSPDNLSTGIIPAPQQVTWGEGAFRMPRTLTYATDLAGQDKADLTAWMNRSAAGRFFLVPFVEAVEGDVPALSLRLSDEGAPESYRLDVAHSGITITAPDAAGLFYGLQSLAQLAEHSGKRIPAVTVEDAPRFAYRGFMLDVSRHFRDKEFVKRQLDLLARYKLNRFHWHLTDGAGWRIEIRKYPELTDFAAWRPYPCYTEWYYGDRHYCHRDDSAAEGGYYTQDEIREVVEYARALHITVIPEIEMPGHSEEVLATYPQLACSGKPYVDKDLCIGNEQTFEFLENVLSEVIELFPSEYIHIGGDEADKASWATCPRCRARMRHEGLKDVDELQSYLVHRIEMFLNSKGRRLLGWDEILQGGLAPDATVMSWRGLEGGIAAARAGHQAVMTPNNYCYLDYCQDDPTREPPAAAAFVTLEKAYSFDPAPDSLGAEAVPMILGVQGNLWCEHVSTGEHAEHMMWPRLMAIAEVGWSLPERKDYGDFHTRVLDAVAWMQERGYHPFDQKNAVGPRPESLEPVQCLSTGKPVIYHTPYSPKYAAAGDGSLTDGLRGDWNYGDQRWQGWLDTDVDLIVDLGESLFVKHIAADFMQGFYADIWMPRAVEISVSDDGGRYTTLATVKNDVPFDFRQDCYREFGWTGEARGRYIRLKALHNGHSGGWIFTDEIIVE